MRPDRLGIASDEIRDAVAVGKTVQKGVMAAMNKFIPTVLDDFGDSLQEGKNRRKTLKVYDPAMCCTTRVCGPNVDKALVEFAGAVKAAASHGVLVDRRNLAQQPQAFTENPQVKDLLDKLGVKGLPFIFLNDELQWTGRYPMEEELFFWFGMSKEDDSFSIPESEEENRNAEACCENGRCCS